MKTAVLKPYAPVLALLALNVVLLLGARTLSNRGSAEAAEKGTIELLHEVVYLRPPLRRPAAGAVQRRDTAVSPVAWRDSPADATQAVTRADAAPAAAELRP